MTPKQLAKDIRAPLFADRGTDMQAAFDYADMVFMSLGTSDMAARTAMHVVLNTLSNVLDTMLDPADNPAAGAPVLEPVTLSLDRDALNKIMDERIANYVEDWASSQLEDHISGWYGDNIDVEREIQEAVENLDFEIRVR